MRGAGSRCWQGPTGLEKCFTRWTPSMEVYLSLFFCCCWKNLGGEDSLVIEEFLGLSKIGLSYEGFDQSHRSFLFVIGWILTLVSRKF